MPAYRHHNQRTFIRVIFRIMDVMTGKIANLEMWQDKPELEAALMYAPEDS